MTKISIGEAFAAAYGGVFRNLPVLVRVAAIPFLLIIILDVAVILFASKPVSPLVGMIQRVLVLVIQVPLITSWLRFTILPREVSAPTLGFNYGPTEIRFLGQWALVWATFLMLTMLAMVSVASGGQGFALVMLILLVAAGYAWSRLSPIFPSTATGGRMTWKEAWALSDGNGWRIFWGFVLVQLPFAVVVLVVIAALSKQLVAKSVDPTDMVIFAVVVNLISLMLAACNSTLVANIFQQLGGKPGGAGSVGTSVSKRASE